MDITKQLDYFITKRYNIFKEVFVVMNQFMTYDFDISEIVGAWLVEKYTPVHTNRPHHGIAFHESGLYKYTFDTGVSLTVQDNTLVYLPKHSNYVVEGINLGNCYAVNFDLHNSFIINAFKFTPKNSAFFLKEFSLIEKNWKKRNIGFQMKCKSHLYNIICTLQNEYYIDYISSKNAEIIIPAIEYIHNNYYKETISIAQMANLCNISDTYFRRIFNQIYGTTPIRYINNLKLTRAKELILSGDYPIHEISFLSGYNDDSYFSREFKKAFGCSPNKYVKEYL